LGSLGHIRPITLFVSGSLKNIAPYSAMKNATRMDYTL